MKAFGHMDYLGDTVLKLFAHESRPSDPDGWLKEYATNRYLAEIYRKINLDNRRLIPEKIPRFDDHMRASFVEAWLGEAYEIAGLDNAREMWERMKVIMEVA